MKHSFTAVLILIICTGIAGAIQAFPGPEGHGELYNAGSLFSPAGPASLFADGFPDTPETEGINNFRVRVYPNPATDYIRVEWELGNYDEIYVEIYDLVGRRVIQRRSEDETAHLRIEIESLQRSAYLLKVFSGDGKFSRTFRIIKN